ncbi:adhesin [Pseudomonas sp. 21]|uniref:VCBS domain-containing protein n=1 Tax=unclassified Pseudomonas TaxID=196821 RepID=UPI0005EB58D7|nr:MULTISPECIES: VCBS domain-containing protein [unclassified Pseudomonas]KJJ97884.1 adhesin [Pseudomonas sp. 21]MBV7586841.1 VCBS domain-containing protein [Pseudomonas sp. PDM33]
MQAKYRSKLFQPAAHALALEQRILFDGAAAAAVDQQHHDSTAAEAKDTAKPATAVEARAQAAAPAQAAPRNLVVIDARLENRDQLAANLPVGTTALVVDAGQDAIAAISNALTQLGKVDSIQIFSHGATGQFTLGNQTFTSQSVDQLGDRLSAWRGELNAGADIQLYGCDVGAGSAGQALVNELARWTGADVGASSNATGSSSAGGDWNLEVRAGDVDKSIALSADTLVSFQGLLADASPTVTMGSGGAAVRLGDTFTFDVNFSNPSTQVGFAPYIDLFMPATGRDGNDGATFVSATYLGQAVTSYVITFDANGNATHPLAKDANGNALVINAASVGMKAGDQMVVLQLPYASVTSGQPAIGIQVTAQLSNLADTSYSDGAPNLTINARGGFEYGNDSLNNPAQDPTLVEAALHSFVVTPTLLSVTQTVDMPEGETVTGPNFTRTETVTVTPAPGQTLTNVTVTQTVPDQVHVSSITPGAGGTLTSITLHDGTVLTNPTLIAAALNNPNAFVASYTIHYDTLSAASTTTVGFYVPEIDAAGRPVLDPATGNPRTITFGTATVSGDWNPLDVRDRPTDPDGYPFTVTGDGAGITFVAKSITLLKTVNLQTDVGTPGITPGDTLRYTMDVAISDFYAFGQNILGQGRFTVTDLLSDGQTFSAANAPSIVIQQHGTSQVIPVIYTATVNADGSTTLVFDIGASIAAAIQGPGLYALFGDLWDDDVQEGATRLTLVYDATIDTTYTSDHPPHDQLNEGDSVSNNATVDATVLRDSLNIGGEQTDGSGTTSTIDTSNIDITLTQVNGGNPPANGELRPGDVVTFTITYDLLVADYENFKLTAYLPLPLLNAAGINWSIGNGVGQWSFGAGNTILDVPDSVTTGAGNSIIFDFGNYVSGGLNGGTVQVRFTMVVGDQPYADQRELDVLAQSSQTTTIDKTPLISSDVAVIESVAEPVLDIKHGVVSTTHGTVTGTTGTWAQPGTTGVPFSGSVTSLAAVDGNVSGIDGADTLRLATAIKNSGGGNAYDVATSITLPAGLAFVGGSLSTANLQIHRGDGTLLVQGVDYSISGNSITFLDANNQGTLLAGRAGTTNDLSGANVVVITYDVTVSNAILASRTLQSSAALTNYASVEGGQDFTPVDIVEVANQQVAAPTITKTYQNGSLTDDDSSAGHTSGSNLVIGEKMTYDIVVTLPEGSTANLRLSDLIPPGLRLDLSAFGGAGYQIITTVAGSGALGQDFAGNVNVLTFSGDGSDGGDLNLVFSAAGATADNNIGNNAFVIRLVLVASNVQGNQQGVTLNNGAQLTYSDPDGDTPNGATAVDRIVASPQQPSVTIVEPTLTVSQQVTSTPTYGGFDEGDTVTYTITISNNSGTNAFDLSLLNVLPTQMDNIIITGKVYNGGATANGGADFIIQNGQLVTANGANIDIANGGSIVISLSGVVNSTAAGQAVISNNVVVRWTSLDGLSNTTDTGAGERGGDDGLLNSGVLNDYRQLNTLFIPVTNGIQVSRVGGLDATPPATNSSGATDTAGLEETVVVGEIIRYRVAVVVPTGENTNYQIRIELAPGLEFIPADLNNILIALGSSTGGLTTDATNLISGGSLIMFGNQNSDVSLPIHPDLSGDKPTGIFNINSGRLQISPDGRTITFNLGNLSNTEINDGDIEGVILEFNVRVANIASNQSGAQLSMNVFEHVGAGAGVDRGHSATIFEHVVEPSFTGMDKSVIDIAAGSVAGTTNATVSVSFTQNGEVPAYNVVLRDQFPNGSDYAIQSIVINGTSYTTGNLPAGVTASVVGGQVVLNFDQLNVNDKVQVIYSVTLPNTIVPDDANSSAVLTWTSLPTSFENAGWGGSVPLGAGGVDGERTGEDGTGGLNDYVLSDGAGMGVIRGTLWDDTKSATTSVTPDGPGLGGIGVTLTWAGDDGVFGNADDRTFNTVTAADGTYQFAILPSGNYLVAVAQNFAQASNNRFHVRVDSDTGTSTVGLGNINLNLAEGAVGIADAGYVHINEAPINTVTDQHGQEDTVLHIVGLTTSDVDVNAGNADGIMTVTLSVVHGVLWQTGTPPGPNDAPPAGAGRTLVLTGTLQQINVLLSQIYYKGDQDFNTARNAETLTMVTNDQGNFGDADGDGIPGENPDDALKDTDTLNIVIDPVNDAPVAHPDLAIAIEAGGLNNADPGVDPTGNVLSNDTDVDIATNGDVLTVTRVENSIGGFATVAATGVTTLAGRYGTLYITATGGFQYVVDNTNAAVQALRSAGDVLRESFGYFVTDTGNATSSTSLTIDIHGANDTPVAQNDVGTAVEAGGTNNGSPGSDAIGNVLLNDTDVDSPTYGETKAVSLVRYDGIGGGRIFPVAPGAPATLQVLYGSLTMNADGSYSYVVDNSNPRVNALSPGETLTEVFTYQVTDKGGLSAIATLTITIQGANDAPVAVDDHANATAGSSDGSSLPVNTSGNVVAGVGGVGADTDVDNFDRPNADKLKVDGVRSGLESAGGTLTGVVNGISTNITGTVARLANGSIISGNFGELSLNDDGTFTFVVNSADPAIRALAANQSLDVIFTYRIHDTGNLTDQAQLVITVVGVNDPPVVQDVSTSAQEAGGLNNTTAGLNPSGSIRNAYSDPEGDPLNISAITYGATSGTVGQALAGLYGSLTLDAQGNFSYVVDNNNATVQGLRTFNDTLVETYRYTVSDGKGGFTTADFVIVIHGQNDTPIAANDTATAIEAGGTNNGTPGQAGSGNVLNNDTDVDTGDGKAVNGIALGVINAGGTFTQVSTGPVATAGAYGTLTVNADGTYSYVVNDNLAAVQALKAGDSLVEVFTYRMNDTAGASSIAQLTITIEGRYDAPVANDDINYAVANLDGSGGRNPTGNVITGLTGIFAGIGADTDVDAGDHMRVTTIAVGPEGSQVNTVAVTPGSPQTIVGAFGTLVINADGSYQYFVDSTNPDIIALGPLAFALESFTYQVTDDGGLNDQATLIILIRGRNEPPVTAPDFGTSVEDGGLHNNVPGSNPSGNVLANDTDPDTITTIPQDVMHVVSFWAGDSPTSTTVTAPGQSLRGQYGTLTLSQDGSWSYVLDNTLPEVEALRASGQTLQDKFTYLGADIWGGATPGLLTITIDGRNDTPIASDDTATAVEAGGVNNGTPGVDPRGNVLDNDTDVDGVQYGETKSVVDFTNQNGSTVNAGSVLQGLYGKLVINADGSYEYRVDNDNPTVQAMRSANEKLQEVFTYRMRDTAGATSDARLTVVIQGANDNPVARDDSNSATDQTPAPQATGNVLPNDSDVDGGDSLTVTGIRTGQETGSGTAGVIGQPIAGRYGTLVLNADGSYTYTIDLTNREVLAAAGLGQVLKDYFTYTISDLAGATDDALLTITLDIATPYIPPGPHLDRLGDDGYPRDRIPDVDPAIFVQPVVERIDDRLSLSAWGADGSNIDIFATPEIESPSLGAQLGQVKGQFVARAVAESRRAANLDTRWVDGRHGVISLTADGLLPDPSLWAPFPADMVGKAEKAQNTQGFRAQLREAAQRRSGQ